MSQVAQDGPKDKLVATHLAEAEHERLVALAREQDRSISWVIRRAITAELDRATQDAVDSSIQEAMNR